MPKAIVGLDVGSSTIKAVIAELKKDGKISISRVFKFDSGGIRRGMVDDVAATTRAISVAISEIKQHNKDAVKNIYLAIGSPNVRTQPSEGLVAVSRADLEICKDDIARAKEMAESVNKIPPNRNIIHSLTEEFVVDDIADIRDPLGMTGTRLKAKSLLVDAFMPAINTLTRCVETAGGSISGLIFNPLAGGRSVLSKNQKDLGVMVVDIGFGTTSFAFYQDNRLLHTGSFPAGAGHITNDLAIGLKIAISAAENIKFSFGSALAKEVPLRETVELTKFDDSTRGNASRRFISEIIESRLAEIFEFIHNELRRFGVAGRLPAGVILTGGGAKLHGVADLVRQELRLPARVGTPDMSYFHIDSAEDGAMVDDPEYACVLGLVLWGADKSLDSSLAGAHGSGWFRKFLNYFMP